ncbi:MAG: hypothetical protein MJ252_03970, partial [archaeon]|nr:hypothetical protein [archaeon]
IGYELSEEEKEWYNNAFLDGRFTMELNMTFKPMPELRKENEFILVFDYQMDDNLLTFFPQHSPEVKVKLTERGPKGDFIKKKYEEDISEIKYLLSAYKEKLEKIENKLYLKNNPNNNSSRILDNSKEDKTMTLNSIQ